LGELPERVVKARVAHFQFSVADSYTALVERYGSGPPAISAIMQSKRPLGRCQGFNCRCELDLFGDLICGEHAVLLDSPTPRHFGEWSALLDQVEPDPQSLLS